MLYCYLVYIKCPSHMGMLHSGPEISSYLGGETGKSELVGFWLAI